MKHWQIVVIGLLLLVGHLESSAATPDTVRRISADAIHFLPATLKQLTTIHWEEINSVSAELAQNKFRDGSHYYWHPTKQEGLSPKLIADNACRSVQMIRKRRPLSQVFALFGEIAFQVAESFNPLNTDNGDQQEIYYYQAYELFVEQFSPEFRLIFRPCNVLPMEQNSLERELEVRLTKLNTLYGPLTREYRQRLAEGKPFDFGYQSIPFGIAMISYSNAVQTVVDLWCSIWKAAGGELDYSF